MAGDSGNLGHGQNDGLAYINPNPKHPGIRRFMMVQEKQYNKWIGGLQHLDMGHMLAPRVFEVRGGKLKARKGVNVPTVQIDCAALTEKDVEAEGKGQKKGHQMAVRWQGRVEELISSAYPQCCCNIQGSGNVFKCHSPAVHSIPTGCSSSQSLSAKQCC